MDKLLDSFEYEDLEVSMLDFSLEKKAAAEEITQFVSQIEPQDDKFYLHINAMGAGEFYGSNRNGDYFPEDNLKKHFKTFETSPAHVFRHHVNKNPEIAIGKVIFAYYNERMHRVELIAELCKQRAAEEYAAIMAGMFPQTSMACHTPFDTCSICGNQAHSRSEYCSHLNTSLNRILDDGRKVFAINNGPLRFFDISIVIRPADITSSVLTKVAGDVIGSAEKAEMNDVSYNKAEKSITKVAVEKFADLIKEVPGDVTQANDQLVSVLGSVRDPDDVIIEDLLKYPLHDVISTMAYLGISPSLEFMLKILVSKYLGKHVNEITSAALEVFRDKGLEAIPDSAKDLVPDMEHCEPDPELIKMLWPYMESSSFEPAYVEKRASGYLNTQPGRSPVPPSRLPARQQSTLLKLIGGAILAKMMINTIAASLTKVASVKSNYTDGLKVRLMNLSLSKDLENFK